MTFTDYIFEFSSGLNKTVVIDKKEVSYTELYTRILKISRAIESSSLKKGDIVILMAENSLFFIEVYFAIIKSGCICVPVNPSTSIKDIEYIIEECEAKLVFLQHKFLKDLDEVKAKEISIYTDETIDEFLWLSEGSIYKYNDKEIYDKEDVAVILFTSGSTAKPKGVMLTHYNLCYNTRSIIEYLKLTSEDRVEVVLPFYYCFGTSLLNTHLRVGGSVVINNSFIFPNSVLEDINRYKCTGFAGVPSTYQILLRKSSIKSMEFPSLRYVAQAGGVLPGIFIKELRESLKNTEIYIMYGQTEATARLSYLPPEKLEEKLGSIGKGIPGTELMVLDKKGTRVKPGEVGEIAASGGNIMKGYYKNRKETSKVIRNGLLYTGDLATIDDEGYIYIVGREKHIIKSGGNRISPKEIEEIMLSISGVIEVVVVGVRDDLLGEAIKVYLVLNNNSYINEEDVIQYCKDRLPSYKIPKYIEFIDELPKNSSGKVMIGELK